MRRLAFVLAVGLSVLPAAAHATCMFNCTAMLVDGACQNLDVQGAPPTVAASGPIRIAAKCETCCSPPGGPLDCGPSDVNFSVWTVQTPEGSVVPGSWQDAPATCPTGEALASWTPTSAMTTGQYELVNQGMIQLLFLVDTTNTPDVTESDAVTAEDTAADSAAVDAGEPDSGASDSAAATDASWSETAHLETVVADAWWPDVLDSSPQDVGTSPPPPSTKAKSDGCSGGRRPTGPVGITALLAGGVLAWWRRRRG